MWSYTARLRRRVRNRIRRPEDPTEARHRWIRENAPGRSFADIGGLYQMEGDIAFTAEESGASPVTLFDAGDPDLSPFDQRRRSRGSSVRYLQGDLEDPESVREIGPHDVVWCTGVIYHTPNPVRQLMNLRAITRELLYLGTLTIPEIPGFRNACVYYPHLDDRARARYAAGYRWARDGAGALLGIGAPVDEAPMRGHGNCWWGITGSALRSMLTTARFEVVEDRSPWAAPFLTELVARPLPVDPMLPPVEYYRERGRARERGEERWAFESWYEDQRA